MLLFATKSNYVCHFAETITVFQEINYNFSTQIVKSVTKIYFYYKLYKHTFWVLHHIFLGNKIKLTWVAAKRTGITMSGYQAQYRLLSFSQNLNCDSCQICSSLNTSSALIIMAIFSLSL